MIPFIYVFITYLVGISFKRKFGYLLNVNFITTFIWSVCAILAYINPMNFVSVSNEVHYYSFLWLIVFNITSLFAKINSLSLDITAPFTTDDERTIWKKIRMVSIISFVMYLPLAIPGILAFASKDYALVKSLYYDENSSFLYMYFVKLIPMAIMRAVSISSLLLYFKNYKRKYLYHSFVFMLIPTITSITRVDLFLFLSTYVILLTIFKHYRKVNYKPLIFGILSMIIVTVTFRGNDIVQAIISYFSGSFSFLQVILDNPADYGLYQNKYGYRTFAFLFEPVILVLKVLGLTTIKTPIYWFNTYCQPFVNISQFGEFYFNNNTTILYNFLLDNGVWGIIVGSIFLSLLLIYSYKIFTKGRMFGTLLFLYISDGLFTSTMSYQSFSGLAPIVITITFYYISRNLNKS